MPRSLVLDPANRHLEEGQQAGHAGFKVSGILRRLHEPHAQLCHKLSIRYTSRLLAIIVMITIVVKVDDCDSNSNFVCVSN